MTLHNTRSSNSFTSSHFFRSIRYTTKRYMHVPLWCSLHNLSNKSPTSFKPKICHHIAKKSCFRFTLALPTIRVVFVFETRTSSSFVLVRVVVCVSIWFRFVGWIKILVAGHSFEIDTCSWSCTFGLWARLYLVES